MEKRDNENYTVLVDIAEPDDKKVKKATKMPKKSKKQPVELDEVLVEKETSAEGNAAPAEDAKKKKKRRRRLGDRSDGRLLRTLEPAARISPYIMHIRSDSQNHFEEEIDITDIETYLREKRAEGYKNLGLLHIIIAAYVRAVSQRPGVNRFIAGNKVYARNNIEVVMTIKKKLSTSAPDTTMKCIFEPTDTLFDVYEKWNAIVQQILNSGDDSDFDSTAKLINLIPGFLMKFAIKFLRFLDYIGMLPKALLKVSPFHSSMVITSMGSLGIGPIYHHLYDFGNLPIFLCYGKKYSKIVLNEAGLPRKRSFVGFRAVTDERICDGYYYASAFKAVMHSIKDPKSLETPPERVVEDID